MFVYKMKFFKFLLGLLNVKFVNEASNPNTNPASFCYDEDSCGQRTWGGICNTGKKQSPIDIQLRLFRPHFAPVTKFELNKHYAMESVHKFYGQNNGHTAQFDLTPNLNALTSDLEIGGGRLRAKYKFAQLHFHWSQVDLYGSEHLINGHSYPMEMHIVHYKSSYASLAEALSPNNTDPEAVAVMAIFFKVSVFKNEELEPIVRALEQLEEPGEITEFNFTLRISDLYPKQLEFVRYSGSLTTPTCDEKVIWTVFLRPVAISKKQMAAFRHLTNEEKLSSFNYRKPQDLHGRYINFYKGIFTLEPIITLYNPFRDLLNILIYFLQNFFNYFKPYFLILKM